MRTYRIRGICKTCAREEEGVSLIERGRGELPCHGRQKMTILVFDHKVLICRPTVT